LRLLLDEQQDRHIAEHLRHDGHDVVAVAERLALRALSDADIFAVAIAERRAVVTENARDFALLHRRTIEQGRSHYGIVLTSHRRFPRRKNARRSLVAALRSLLRTHRREDALRDQVVWLA
jgi:predicted nuclease of predicted toxin-antitoxin system